MIKKIIGFAFSDKKLRPVDPQIGQINPEKLQEFDEEDFYKAAYNNANANLDYIYKHQNDLIAKYRSLDMSHYVSDAIDDIVDESIVMSENGYEAEIRIDIDNTNFTDNIKKKIADEWNYFSTFIYDVNNRIANDFRNWYVTGQSICYLIKDDIKGGLKEMRTVDPMFMAKLIQKKSIGKDKVELTEKWIYDIRQKYASLQNSNLSYQADQLRYAASTTFGSNVMENTGLIEIELDSIAYSNSGIRDVNGYILSYLHKAIKPYNDLMNFENSILIYTIARAPQRRIFYVDVGLNKGKKAEKYIQDLINQHKNKMLFDEKTGQLKESFNIRSMLEDYWLPRQDGSRGTDVQTLDGGGSLADSDTLKYYQDLLYKALKSPASRRIDDPGMLVLGRASEVSRDEIKRAKFINKLTKRFSKMIIDGFVSHIVLKKIITPEESKVNRGQFKLIFGNEGHFTEIKNNEILQGRLEVLDSMSAYVGKYFTDTHIFKDVLHLTDEEIDKRKKEIQQFNKEKPEEDDKII